MENDTSEPNEENDTSEPNEKENWSMTRLPMEALIGGPLQAANRAQIMLAKSTADFITTVGFIPNSKTGQPEQPRQVDFAFNRHNQNSQTGEQSIEKVHVNVPLLSIVQVPNLSIDSVDIVFDMEVNSFEQEQESESTSDKDIQAEDIKIYGTTTTYKENTRTSDKTSKYHFEIHATNHGTPEALARILDMMAASVAPVVEKDESQKHEVSNDSTLVPKPDDENANSNQVVDNASKPSVDEKDESVSSVVEPKNTVTHEDESVVLSPNLNSET